MIRVATAQGKQGIWILTFPDREKTGNLVNLMFCTGKFWQHSENFEHSAGCQISYFLRV